MPRRYDPIIEATQAGTNTGVKALGKSSLWLEQVSMQGSKVTKQGYSTCLKVGVEVAFTQPSLHLLEMVDLILTSMI